MYVVCRKPINFKVVCTLALKLNEVGMKFFEVIPGLFLVNLFSLFTLADFSMFLLYILLS